MAKRILSIFEVVWHWHLCGSLARAIKSFTGLNTEDTRHTRGNFSVKASCSPLQRGVEGSQPYPSSSVTGGGWFIDSRDPLQLSWNPESFGGAWGGWEGEHTLEKDGGHISFWLLNQLTPRCVRVYWGLVTTRQPPAHCFLMDPFSSVS